MVIKLQSGSLKEDCGRETYFSATLPAYRYIWAQQYNYTGFIKLIKAGKMYLHHC